MSEKISLDSSDCISKQNIYFCINHDATDTKNRDT